MKNPPPPAAMGQKNYLEKFPEYLDVPGSWDQRLVLCQPVGVSVMSVNVVPMPTLCTGRQQSVIIIYPIYQYVMTRLLIIY